jgi:site-specific DNA-methyltransferase (cytosine-N4-specific)
MNLSQRLQEFRDDRNLSPEDLAVLVGVKPINIIKWENGTSFPSISLANKLELMGFGKIELTETKQASTPRLTVAKNDHRQLRDGVREDIELNRERYEFDPMPYVVNGPENQLKFFETLYGLQEHNELPCSPELYSRRLSLVANVSDLCEKTAQFDLESPKRDAKHWNPNYGSHGWHRYIGRFPPQLVRALLNHFKAQAGDVICDPFSGSGTTLVESRLLGMKAIGIEVCPLSALISRTKSGFPLSTTKLEELSAKVAQFYQRRWSDFVRERELAEISHEEILARSGNSILAFTNYEKWMSKEALLGSSIIVELATTLDGYNRDFICCALSACMRSIGNLDVDVVRAEYSKKPRQNVAVLKLVQRKLKSMLGDINKMLQTHHDLMSEADDIKVVQNSLLEADIPDGSVDHIITSPPYGIESVSYIRTHLLSYRSLQPVLDYNPYTFDEKIIGSEYVKETNSTVPTWDAVNYSPTFVKFFDQEMIDEKSKKFVHRRDMTVNFFDDMVKVAQRFQKWLRPGGRLAFVVGNKRLGEKIIPTDRIITEIFEFFGLRLDRSIEHKLKCNNSNSEVPWQDRIIQEEFVMLFTNTKK